MTDAISLARLPTATVDRGSALPYYFQLKRMLEDEIRSGRWQPGLRVPSEPTIGEHFGLSRTTVRQALSQLEDEGLIRRERGRGTYVAEPSPGNWIMRSAASFHESAASRGLQVRSEVIRREVLPVPDWARDLLGLGRDADAVVLARRRWLDGDLVMYVENVMPVDHADLVLGAELERGSLYAALREGGVEIAGGRRVVQAAAASARIAEQLEVEAGSPVLYIEALSWKEDEHPLECYRAWHCSETCQLEVWVGPGDAPEAMLPTERRGR